MRFDGCLLQLITVVLNALQPPKNNKKIGSKEGEYEGLFVAYFQKSEEFPLNFPGLFKGIKLFYLILLVEHVLSILASLCRNLTGGQRSRLVQKFVEDDHIKVREQLTLEFPFLWKIA